MRYQDAAIVVLGSFNPSIFQPEWLRRRDLLPAFELDHLDSPNSMLVANEIASLTFKSLQLLVQRDRFQLATERPDWVKDLGGLAKSIFEALQETPVSTVGLNVNEHRSGRNSGRVLIERWLPFHDLGKVAGESSKMLGVVRAQWEGFRAAITVDESTKKKDALFVGQNYEKTVSSVSELLPVLSAEWPRVIERADRVVTRLVSPEVV